MKSIKARKKCRSKRRRRALKTASCYYCALGDGEKRAFTVEDAIPGYDSRIPDPAKATIINVFVDGMLQDPLLYEVTPGMLLFLSNDPPPNESRIIAQFIAVYGH